MPSLGDNKVIYPIVEVKVGGNECHALLDSGASSCYASAKLLNLLRKQPMDIKPKETEMFMAFTTVRMEIFQDHCFIEVWGLKLGCQSH